MEESARAIPIALRYRGIRVDRPQLRRLVGHCLDEENASRGAGCGFVLAGGRLLRTLNREWRGIDRTTDVLSFFLGDGPPLPPGAEEAEPQLLGEVVISVPRCLEQAGAAGLRPGEELVRLSVHGILHVLGHDHEKPEDRARMVPRERRYRAWAARAGIGPRLLRVLK